MSNDFKLHAGHSDDTLQRFWIVLCFLKSVNVFYLFHLKVVKLAALKLQTVSHLCQAAIEMSAKLFYWFLMAAVINYPHKKKKKNCVFT